MMITEVHGCCQHETLEHLTTCHYCGLRGELDPRGEPMVGEPLCTACVEALRCECCSARAIDGCRHSIEAG